MAKRYVKKTFHKSGTRGHGSHSSRYKTTVAMGKKFRTRAGRYGCYVYINGRRSHFEESTKYSKRSSTHQRRSFEKRR